MLLNRWSYKTHTYKPYESPAKTVMLITDNMDDVVDCASCGQPVVYGVIYTSKEIHTALGLGYPVCSGCYDSELVRASNDSR